ncbi:hypothetical protein OOU_Y34scaffold00881g1 [Pyricularia oryzae Y34]|uniref:Uncharacterized protein n=1 Tax=Pyricularia oryzae (strain Y34) TaxID=1143189 RepID=A0AA97NP46_PYRO3|nr:hypothetical protein OOU_Y34scaffold00881g1 [Pyricularia oryzae Y34]
MCQKAVSKYDCLHVEKTEWFPKDPEECPRAVAANRRHASSGKLLHCYNTETYEYVTGGYCDKSKCRKWYFKEYGWTCCQCWQQVYNQEQCHCRHAICMNCRSVVPQEGEEGYEQGI